MILKLYQIGGTPKAGCFSHKPKDSIPPPKGFWIPKVAYIVHSREPDRVWQWPACTVEVFDWWARKNKARLASQPHPSDPPDPTNQS